MSGIISGSSCVSVESLKTKIHVNMGNVLKLAREVENHSSLESVSINISNKMSIFDVFWALLVLACINLIHPSKTDELDHHLVKHWYAYFKYLYNSHPHQKPMKYVYADIERMVNIEYNPNFGYTFGRLASACGGRLMSTGHRMPVYLGHTKKCVLILGLLNKKLTLTKMIKKLFDTQELYCLHDEMQKISTVSWSLSDRRSASSKMMEYIFSFQKLDCSLRYQASLTIILSLFGEESLDNLDRLIYLFPPNIFADFNFGFGSRDKFTRTLPEAVHKYLMKESIISISEMLAKEEPMVLDLYDIIDIEFGKTCNFMCQLCRPIMIQMFLFKTKFDFDAQISNPKEVIRCKLCCIVTQHRVELESKVWTMIAEQKTIY